MTLRGSPIGNFRAFYVQHYGFVWSVLRRFGVEGPATADAVQDTFVTAYRRRADYRGLAPKPWLYGIARRVASNYRRTHARGRRRQQAIHEMCDAESSEASARRTETMLDLERVVAALPCEDRELFFLSEVDGLSGPELARALRLNTNTVYWRIRRLRDRLSAIAEEHTSDVAALRACRPEPDARTWAALVPWLQAASQASAVAPWLGALACVAGLSFVAGVWLPHRDDQEPPQRVHERSEVPTPKRDPRTSEATPGSPVALPGSTAAHRDVSSTSPVQTADRLHARKSAPVRKAVEADPEPASLASGEDVLRAWNRRLQAASDALRRGDARAALEATQTDAAAPSQPLEDLRIALRIESLCALGQREVAQDDASAFLRRRPGAAMRGRIERSCAGPPRIDPVSVQLKSR